MKNKTHIEFWENNMRNCNDRLLSLLTCAIRGESGQHVLAAPVSEEEIRAIFDLAKKHDMTHLIGAALETTEPQDKKRYKPFFGESIKAMYRYEWLKGEQDKMYALLEQYGIPYIPLKGAIIRKLYREPWHRTSCDIDILVPQERLEEALAAFENDLSYTRGERSLHDVSLTAPNGVHFELHFNMDEVYVDCAELWADAQQAAPESCQYTLSAEMLILTPIAHMAKHFVNGGCGLRPFLDLWLMREKLPYDRDKLLQMLDSHGLTKFSSAMFGLVDVWFDGKTANETEMMIQAFILPAGVYGDLNNKISVTRSEGKGKLAYAIQRIFPPRSSLRIAYPVLNRHPRLLPICWVRRWIRLIRAGKLKQVKTEYDINRRLDADKLNHTSELLKRLELKMGKS